MSAPDRICWDEHGGLYLPPEYAYIGVAMDRRDAADEMQRAFDGAASARCEHPNTRPATIDDQRPFCVRCLRIVGGLR